MALLVPSLCLAALAATPPSLDDWPGFRGPGAAATATDEGYATEWDDERNIPWRAELPGPGSSSPIVVGDAVLISCWSGYGIDPTDPGERSDLTRHLMAFDRDSGEALWEVTTEAAAVEDPYEGRLRTHGYASSTPTSDGERVYVFYGKRGVFAFDLEGEQLWHAEVGQSSSEWNTGSASSPVLCGDVLVVNAADEGRAIHGFDKKTGEERWKIEQEGLDLAFDTPVLVGSGEDQVLAFALLEQIWGLDPKTGDRRWTVRTKTNGSLAPSIVSAADILYSIGGQAGERSYAVRLGGEGDVTDSHVVWRSRTGSYVPSPVLHEGHLYWVADNGIAHCMRAADAELVYRERLGDEYYASVVRAGDVLLATSREGGCHVLPAEPRFEVLATNVIESDGSRFDASPALSRGQIFLRSQKFLYCIEDVERPSPR